MTGDDPLIRLEHIIDAVIVGVIVFCSVILGDVLLSLTAGEPAYITADQILTRSPTGAVAFVLTFAAQFARARGIAIKDVLFGPGSSGGSDDG